MDDKIIVDTYVGVDVKIILHDEEDNGEEVEICIDNVIGFETTEDNKAKIFYYWMEEGTSMVVTETPEEVREIVSAAKTKKKAIKDNYVVVEKLPEDVKFQTVRLDILDRLYEREQCFMTLIERMFPGEEFAKVKEDFLETLKKDCNNERSL